MVRPEEGAAVVLRKKRLERLELNSPVLHLSAVAFQADGAGLGQLELRLQ
jgi:hypothetical protein